ncbi:MAG: hypothetical protein DMG89_10645 [Acidobacteria bacterium]|nr:MAG: hypothetical protein DMG89_10645 [Acidobacteriota bacterium]
MKLVASLWVLLLFGGLSAALVTDKRSGSSSSILPNQFSGWQMAGSSHASKDPGAADPVNASVLREYGFTDFESATYTRDDGRKLALKAARFQDASGAYGAFTYYKLPQMLVEKIGDQAASLNERVLFYRANVLVDAVFDKLNVMSAAELRELAGQLPILAGNSSKLPGLPAYLPKAGYVKNTAKYVVGPVSFRKLEVPIPAELIDFSAGAEVVVGTYQTSGGNATLILVNYPTNQIAADHLQKLESARQQNGSASGVTTGSPFFDKRTGPILVIASGSLSQNEGKSLLAAVNYDANVTWNENTYLTKKDNLANLLVNIIILCGILILFAAVAGVAFGGIRLFIRRILPERVFDEPERGDFISLHLEDAGRSQDGVSTSIKAI